MILLLDSFYGLFSWNTFGILKDILAEHSYGTFSFVGHSCRSLLWNIFADHSCRTFLWDICIRHFYGKNIDPLLWGINIGHSFDGDVCGIFL